MEPITDARRRWLALYVLCLASLMSVLDVTIIGVALPSIRTDLGFSETSLAWLVNGYLLTYGGFLLLGGRLGDLFGHRSGSSNSPGWQSKSADARQTLWRHCGRWRSRASRAARSGVGCP